MSNYLDPQTQPPHHQPGPQAQWDGQAATRGHDVPPMTPGGAWGITKDERAAAVLAHVSALLAMILSASWLSFLGPLAVWAVYKDRSEFVRTSAAHAFNFNLSMWVLNVVGWALCFTFVLIPVGLPMIAVSVLAQFFFHIRAAMVVNHDRVYRYPMTFLPVLH